MASIVGYIFSTHVTQPHIGNSYAFLKHAFGRHISRVFIELEDGKTYTFADADEISARFARMFENLALRQGDKVLAQVEKSPEALFLYLACLRYGLIYIPVNPAYTYRELEYIIKDTRCSLIVCRPQDESHLQEVARRFAVGHVKTLGISSDGSLMSESEYVPPYATVREVESDTIACFMYTSGTTGEPKAAMISHGNIVGTISALQKVWQMKSRETLLHTMAIFHGYGLLVALNLALYNALKVIFLSRFDEQKIIDFLPRTNIYMGAPSSYIRLLASDSLTPSACKRVRLFVASSAPLSEKTFHAFENRTKKRIVERYGMTESLINTSNILGEEKPGSCGTVPDDGIELRIADDSGVPVEHGVVGHIEVRSHCVFQGYWNDVEKTKKAFRPDGFFITGDVGTMDDDGYVKIVGRTQDVILCNGTNIYPKEVEKYIDAIEGVDESAVFGLPDSIYGESVAAAVKVSNPSLSRSSITEKVRNDMADFKIPKYIFFVGELPRNEMGKVQKQILRNMAARRLEIPPQ